MGAAADKYLLLCHSAKPPPLDETLHRALLAIAPWCCWVHFAIATWVYGPASAEQVPGDVTFALSSVYDGNVRAPPAPGASLAELLSTRLIHLHVIAQWSPSAAPALPLSSSLSSIVLRVACAPLRLHRGSAWGWRTRSETHTPSSTSTTAS